MKGNCDSDPKNASEDIVIPAKISHFSFYGSKYIPGFFSSFNSRKYCRTDHYLNDQGIMQTYHIYCDMGAEAACKAAFNEPVNQLLQAAEHFLTSCKLMLHAGSRLVLLDLKCTETNAGLATHSLYRACNTLGMAMFQFVYESVALLTRIIAARFGKEQQPDCLDVTYKRCPGG